MNKEYIQTQLPIVEVYETIDVSWVVFADLTNPLRPHVLVGERVGGGHTFPGGKVEVGQSPDDAAISESFQEVGLHIPSHDFIVSLEEVIFTSKLGLIHAHPYLVFFDEIVGSFIPTTKEPDLHKQWSWISLNELAGLVGLGSMPFSVWDEKGWLDIIKEVAFIQWSGEDLYSQEDLPASFLHDCHQYKVFGLWEEFEKLYLK